MNRLMLQRVLIVSLIFFSITLTSQDVKKDSTDTIYKRVTIQSKMMKKNMGKLDSVLIKLDTVKRK